MTSMAELAARWVGQDERPASELTFTSAGGFRLAIRQSPVRPHPQGVPLHGPAGSGGDVIEVAELVTLKLAFEEARDPSPQVA